VNNKFDHENSFSLKISLLLCLSFVHLALI
jgi:hypothetical protein